MTTLYIVQAEEGSGIPSTPEVYTDKDLADKAYVDAWREAWSGDLGYDNLGPDRKAEVDETMAGDFDDDWPEDGGVRMWVLVDGELPYDLVSLPATPDHGHDFTVRCSYCLEEPFDVADVAGKCPERGLDSWTSS